MSILTKPIQDVTVDDIQQLIVAKVRESYYVEYKAQWPSQAIAVWLCAFANYEGGLILVGVDADGNGFPTAICGVPNDQAKPDSVDLEAYHVTPPIFGLWESRAIQLTTDPSRSVLVIRVKPGAADVPYNVDGVSYIRTDGSKRKLIDPQSPRVGVASATEMIALLRKRASAIELRKALVLEAMSRQDEHINAKTDIAFEVVIVPEHIYDPKGIVPLEKFLEIATSTAQIYTERSFPFFGTDNLLRLREGIGEMTKFGDRGLERQYIDVSRSGLIAYRSASRFEYRGQFEPGGTLFVFKALFDLIHLCVYAARLYNLLGKNINVQIQANLFNVAGKIPFPDNPYFYDHEIAENVMSLTAAVSTFDLAKNPLDALSPAIADFIFPAKMDLSHSMKHLSENLKIRNIYENGSWKKDWIGNISSR